MPSSFRVSLPAVEFVGERDVHPNFSVNSRRRRTTALGNGLRLPDSSRSRERDCREHRFATTPRVAPDSAICSVEAGACGVPERAASSSGDVSTNAGTVPPAQSFATVPAASFGRLDAAGDLAPDTTTGDEDAGRMPGIMNVIH